LNRLKSRKFISNAAINIKYSNPTVPNKAIPLSFEIRLNPLGPIRMPATNKPIIPGILNLFESNGKNKKMKSKSVNANTGSAMGR
jgi:hypothetical protein